MSITLSPETEQLVARQLETGLFDSADDLVREALRELEEREAEYARLRAEIQTGLDQIDRGETVPWTSELMEQLLHEAREKAERGKPTKVAVKPQP